MVGVLKVHTHFKTAVASFKTIIITSFSLCLGFYISFRENKKIFGSSLLSHRYKTGQMNELDENGWGNIHHAAYRGFLKSVERFIKADNELLELETDDDLKSTPLLLAVMSGSQDVVESLIGMGARIHAVDSQNHGAIELCAFKKHIDMLRYFIKLNHERLPVWKILIKFMTSDTDEEAEAGAKCLNILTTPQGEEQKTELVEKVIPHLEEVFDNGRHIYLCVCTERQKKKKNELINI